MPFGVGPLELVLVLVILLVVFGAKRLPDIARSLGSSAREFKGGISGEPTDDEASEPEKLSTGSGHEDDKE